MRLAAPLLHFGTAIMIYQVAQRLYDARIAFWSSVAYATLPGVWVSAVIIMVLPTAEHEYTYRYVLPAVRK